MNYYNEIDPFAAEWIRNLIKAGHIAPGDVDTRSIEDVTPADLRGYVQCHFFAGIGVWSYALSRAGWPDDRPVWTGSCPCQPFSSAGKGAGFADERHLWPAFYHLISQCRPPVVFGEQVASKDGLAWLDLVQVDLEAARYATAAADICAAGVGAPHIRQRLYWVADADTRGGKGRDELREPSDDLNGSGTRRLADADGRGQRERSQCNGDAPQPGQQAPLRDNAGGRLAHGRLDNNNTGLEGLRVGHCAESGRHGAVRPVAEAGESGGVGNTESNGPEVRIDIHGELRGQGFAEGCDAGGVADADSGRRGQSRELGGLSEIFGRGPDERVQIAGTSLRSGRPSPTNGHWRDADWLYCRDGKWRPVEPSTFPLAHGAASRVGRLRAYGNAIVPQVAETFIRAYLEC